MHACIDRGAQHPGILTESRARQIAFAASPRRTGEAIGIYEARLTRNTEILLDASLAPGNPLHRYLTRLQPFTSAVDRPHALTHAAREALRARAA